MLIKKNIPYLLSVHDFYYICPSIHLINENYQYCNFDCENCHSFNIDTEENSHKILDIWQKLCYNILKNAKYVIFPSNSAIGFYEDVFNSLDNFKLREKRFLDCLSDYKNIIYKKVGSKPALYIPKDNYLVKTLCDIYNEEANSYLEPIAIGGATYARAFDNCVSFGANLPGQKDMCHQTDEFISIDNLLFACKVYAKAICELGK